MSSDLRGSPWLQKFGAWGLVAALIVTAPRVAAINAASTCLATKFWNPGMTELHGLEWTHELAPHHTTGLEKLGITALGQSEIPGLNCGHSYSRRIAPSFAKKSQ